MQHAIHIAIDVMGGDEGPQPAVAGSLEFLARNPSVRISLLGVRSAITPLLTGQFADRVQLIDIDSSVDMSDRPGYALRHKSSSSMARAIALVADGEADACVSAGNTGALMAFGLRSLRTCGAIERPAICKAVPAYEGKCYLLDLGANLDCSAENLVQFALMGAALAAAEGRERPRVGVLNVGSEAQKGRAEQQIAAQRIAQFQHVAFLGFIEGDDIFSGDVDVAVCDGFTGNLILKASEGAARLLQQSLRHHIRTSPLARLGAALAGPALQRWRREYQPARYNGAALLGLNGVVVKSHGRTTAEGFCSALEAAREQVERKVPALIAAAAEQSLLHLSH